MSVPIQPLADYVVAVAEEAESRTASGLYLPDAAKEKPKVAKIVAIGPAVQQIKVGDRVLYKAYTNTDVKVGRDEYSLVKEEDILATVK